MELVQSILMQNAPIISISGKREPAKHHGEFEDGEDAIFSVILYLILDI